MAEPEDPEKPTPSRHEDDFDDDLVGFAHPRSLEASRPPEPVPEPSVEPEPAVAPEPRPASVIEPEPDRFVMQAIPEPEPRPQTAPPPREPEPESLREPADVLAADYGQPGATRTFERAPSRSSEPGVTAEGDGRLALAIYICLIGAAPSAGLTLLIALMLAWTARFLIKGWTRSHLLYQLRTSLIGTIGGVVGVLTLPLGLGVFVLSLTLIWVVARGAAGLYRLMRRQPIRDPQTWSLP